MHSEIAYLEGCLEAERGQVDSFWSDMWTFRGRLVVLFNRVVRMEVWVRRSGTPKPKVNDEDGWLSLMLDLMGNLAESARLVTDLQGANDELQIENLWLQGCIHDLELSMFREH